MSQYSPSGYPPDHRPVPPKYRPSAAWFVAGIGLIVAAVVIGVGTFVWLLAGFFQTDATVPADGRPHLVALGTDGDRMVWTDETIVTPGCTLLDEATGDPIELRPVGGELRRNSGSAGDWVGTWRFDPGSGRVEVTCAGSYDGELVEIGPAPDISSFVVGLIAMVVVPGLLGLAGVITLIVTGVLWSVREPRPRAS